MSQTTKIILGAAILAAVGLIIWRRHMAAITDVAAYTPSHNLQAASEGTSGSVAQPPPLNKFGTNAKDDAAILQDAINRGAINVDQASQIYTYTEAHADKQAVGNHPGPPPSAATVVPSTGPSVEAPRGRGHF